MLKEGVLSPVGERNVKSDHMFLADLMSHVDMGNSCPITIKKVKSKQSISSLSIRFSLYMKRSIRCAASWIEISKLCRLSPGFVGWILPSIDLEFFKGRRSGLFQDLGSEGVQVGEMAVGH